MSGGRLLEVDYLRRRFGQSGLVCFENFELQNIPEDDNNDVGLNEL
jgi:hypothetical protein